MKQTFSTLLFLLLFALAAAAIFMSLRTTFQFAGQLNHPTPAPTLRVQPTALAKPTPVATGDLGKRSFGQPS